MMYFQQKNINSVLDQDVKQVFNTIITFHDPFKSRNKKTRVLDMTHSHYWGENIRNFDVTKTNNINGYAKDKKYNIIIFEPPRNKKFDKNIQDHLTLFPSLLDEQGIIVIKVCDFHLNGRLKGKYEIQSFLDNIGFDLIDNIVFKHKQYYSDFNSEKPNLTHSTIIHSNFMIYKKKS